jgi:hypothetical protein
MYYPKYATIVGRIPYCRKAQSVTPPRSNFAAMQEWNATGAYQKAIALMGRQIDGDK